MVNLGKNQTKFLAQLNEEKAIYDKAVRDLDVELRVRKEQLKLGLSSKVREALDMGIPARQVALRGLGYADVGSLKQYLVDIPRAATIQAEAIEAEKTKAASAPGPYPVVVTGYDEQWGEVTLTDTFGEEKVLSFLKDANNQPALGLPVDLVGVVDARQIKDEIDRHFNVTVDWS